MRLDEDNEEDGRLREALQQLTWETRKALAWVCVTLIAAIYLVLRLPEYPTWTLLFFVPLGVFLFWNLGDWHSSSQRTAQTKARLGSLDKQIKEREPTS
jgi:hypothetical protein